MKVALNEKRKKLRRFYFSRNIANFEAFLSVFKLTKNLFFLKDGHLCCKIRRSFRWTAELWPLLDWFIFTDYYGHGMKEYNFFQNMKFVVMKINYTWTDFWTFASKKNKCKGIVIIIRMYYTYKLLINVSKYQSIYMIQNTYHIYALIAVCSNEIINDFHRNI